MASARGRSSVKVSSSKKNSRTCGNSRRACAISADHVLDRARAVALPAHRLRPEAEGALRAAAAAGVERDVGMQQVADEVVLDRRGRACRRPPRRAAGPCPRAAGGRACDATLAVDAVGQPATPASGRPWAISWMVKSNSAPATNSIAGEAASAPRARPPRAAPTKPIAQRRVLRLAAPRPPSRRRRTTACWCASRRGRTAARAGARRRGVRPSGGASTRREPGTSAAGWASQVGYQNERTSRRAW